MASKKIIAVVGATGAQGGGLVDAILSDPDGGFAVRALTRNPDSDAGKALAARGAEVVQADLDDVASLERAFAGAYGAYLLTNYWEHYSPEKEKEQARNMAAAAKAAGLQHVVWSTLEDTRKLVPLDDDRMPTLMDRYKVPHYDAKGESDAYFREAGVPTTFLLTSFYWDNFIHFGSGPQRGEDGVLALVLPIGDKKLASIAVKDIGRSAYGVFKAGKSLIGKTVGIAGGHLTGKEMAAGMSRVLGEPVVYRPVPPEVYRGFGFPGADDLGNMFQYKADFNDAYCGARPLEGTRKLNPDLMSFDAWLDANGSRIPVE